MKRLLMVAAAEIEEHATMLYEMCAIGTRPFTCRDCQGRSCSTQIDFARLAGISARLRLEAKKLERPA